MSKNRQVTCYDHASLCAGSVLHEDFEFDVRSAVRPLFLTVFRIFRNGGVYRNVPSESISPLEYLFCPGTHVHTYGRSAGQPAGPCRTGCGVLRRCCENVSNLFRRRCELLRSCCSLCFEHVSKLFPNVSKPVLVTFCTVVDLFRTLSKCFENVSNLFRTHF